jgi:hypothetical protein
LQVVGSAMISGTFDWVIFGDGELVANGQFVLAPLVQFADTALCLPLGNYEINVSPTNPNQSGIVYYSVSAPDQQSTPSTIVTASMPVMTPFTFYGPCISGTLSVGERSDGELLTAPREGGIEVWSTSGEVLGTVWMFDAQGRLLFSTRTNADRQFIPVDQPGVYLIRVGGRSVKVLGGLE